MSVPESRYVETRGYRTHYIEAGQGSPVLLIHGGGAGADCRGNWASTLPAFAAAHRTIAYDMVGFGGSDAPDPEHFGYTNEARTAQLVALIEALRLGPVDVVGNSMGGCTALGAAIERPDLIRRLVLMGSAGLSHSVAGPIAAIVNYDFTLEGMRRLVAALTHPDFRPDEALLQRRLELSLRPATRKAFGATMGIIRQCGGLHLEESAIATIKHRTLVINGKNDQVVPLAQAYRFLELLENSTGLILPHCGHWAMIEHPRRFSRAVLEYLQE